MSSVTSQMAQIGRRIGYFIATADCSGYDVSQSTVNYNSWNANRTTQVVGDSILQDMGEIAKVNGQVLRKVRLVTQNPAGGIASTFFIVMPGGEYPVQGYGAGSYSGLPPATVARLG